MMEFRWNEWNLDHIGGHGVDHAEAEFVIEHARNPFPRYDGGGKCTVSGAKLSVAEIICR